MDRIQCLLHPILIPIQPISFNHSFHPLHITTQKIHISEFTFGIFRFCLCQHLGSEIPQAVKRWQTAVFTLPLQCHTPSPPSLSSIPEPPTVKHDLYPFENPQYRDLSSGVTARAAPPPGGGAWPPGGGGGGWGLGGGGPRCGAGRVWGPPAPRAARGPPAPPAGRAPAGAV